MNVAHQNINQLRALCEKHNVETLYLFGSAANGSLKPESDVDFLVRFKNFDLSKYFENYTILKESLKKLFNRDVDLVEEQTLKNPVLIRSIEKSKELIYG